MLSKTILPAIAILASLAVGGCSLVREPRSQGGMKLGGPGPKCLKKFNPELHEYFEGRMEAGDSARAASVSECVSGAIDYFAQFTQGAKTDSYAATELRSFLNRYLPPESSVSEAFMGELMALKQALFGGSATQLTRAELKEVNQLVALLGEQMVEFLPYMPLGVEKARTLGDEEFALATKLVREASARTGSFFEKHGADYPMERLEALIGEVVAFYSNGAPGGAAGIESLKWAGEQMPIVRVVKAMLLGSSEDVIERGEWDSLLTLAGRMHSLSLLYARHSDRLAPWSWDQSLDSVEALAAGALELLSDAAAKHPGGEIPYSSFERLIEVASRQSARKGLLSAEITKLYSDAIAKGVLAKQMLLGNAGEVDLKTLRALVRLVGELKAPLRSLGPRLVALDPSDLLAVDPARLDETLKRFDEAAPEISGAIARFYGEHGKSYAFSPFNGVLDRISPLFVVRRSEALPDWQALGNDSIRIGQALKGLILGPPYDRMDGSAWSEFSGLAVKLGKIFYLSEWGAANQASWTRSQSVAHAFRVAGEGATILVDATRARPILLTEIETLIKALAIEDGLRAKLLMAVPELMLLKHAVVGGGRDRVTHAEAIALREAIGPMRAAALEIIPYADVTFEQWKAWSPEQARAFSSSISLAGERLALAFANAGEWGYGFRDLERLLERLEALEVIETSVARGIRENLPLFGAVKGLLVSAPENRVHARDWAPLFRNLSSWAAWGAEAVQLAFSDQPVNRGPGLLKVLELNQGLARSLGASIRSQGTDANVKGIPFLAFDRLIDEVFAMLGREGRKPDVKPATLKAALRPFIERVLGARRASEPGQVSGLTARAARRLSMQVERWARVQLELEKVFVTLGRFGSPDLVFDGPGYNSQMLLKTIHPANMPDVSGVGAHEVIRHLVESYMPYFLGQDRSMSFTNDGKRELFYSHWNLSLMNTLWSITRTLFSGYAGTPAQAREFRVQVGEFEALLRDVWPLVKELKLLASQRTVEVVAQLRFREANIFTAHGNGDEFLDRNEVVDMLSMIVSSWPMVADTYSEAKRRCPTAGVDSAGRDKIDTICFRDVFWHEEFIRRHFGKSLPGLAKFLNGISDRRLTRFIKSMESASRIGGATDDPTDLSDVEGYVLMFHYLEAWFKRFDSNRNDVLSLDESLEAFPVVCRELKIASKLSGTCKASDVSSLQALYGYMLTHAGPPPRADGFFSGIEAATEWGGWYAQWWTIRKTDCDSCFSEPGRSRFMDIIASLSAL